MDWRSGTSLKLILSKKQLQVLYCKLVFFSNCIVIYKFFGYIENGKDPNHKLNFLILWF